MTLLQLSSLHYLLPAFVIGYELPTPWTPFNLKDVPPWLLTIDQQSGGYACLHPNVFGCILRVKSNADRAISDIAESLDGPPSVFSDTHGENYHRDQLSLLHGWCSEYFRLPQLMKGSEAFLTFALCNPLDYFSDWKVVSASLRPGATQSTSWPPDKSRHSKVFYVNDPCMLEVSEEEVFDQAKCDLFESIGPKLGNPPGPHVFYLWENSD